MIYTRYIPTDRIRSMKIYINKDRLSLSTIVDRTGRMVLDRLGRRVVV